LPRFRDFLITAGMLDEESDQTTRESVDQEVEEAIDLADAAQAADPESALQGVYAP